MTRDPAMQEMYRSDRLRHNRISAPLFFGMVEGGEMLLARAGEIRLPILMLIGGQDPVICPESNREFFDRLGSEDKTLLLYPRMLHEPFNELGREQVFEDLARWLEPRLDRSARAPAKPSTVSELRLGDLDRLEQALGLVQRLLVLGAGDAVVDDAAAGLDVGGLALEDQGPQGDAGVHVAGEVDVADGAGVGPALGRLDLVDDLHGPDLGSAGDRAGGQAGAQGVEGRLARAEAGRSRSR